MYYFQFRFFVNRPLGVPLYFRQNHTVSLYQGSNLLSAGWMQPVKLFEPARQVNRRFDNSYWAYSNFRKSSDRRIWNFINRSSACSYRGHAEQPTENLFQGNQSAKIVHRVISFPSLEMCDREIISTFRTVCLREQTCSKMKFVRSSHRTYSNDGNLRATLLCVTTEFSIQSSTAKCENRSQFRTCRRVTVIYHAKNNSLFWWNYSETK